MRKCDKFPKTAFGGGTETISSYGKGNASGSSKTKSKNEKNKYDSTVKGYNKGM